MVQKSLFLISFSLIAALQLAPAQPQPNSKANSVHGAQQKPAPRPTTLPANIKLTIEVEEMPGFDKPGSFWEAGYEIRLVDWRTIVESTKSGADFADAGTPLVQSSFAHKLLYDKESRRLVVTLPVRDTLLRHLQDQANNPQAFSLRSSVRLYDAQLDRSFAFKVDRIWQFKLFPDGEASVSIKIKPDGAFSVFGPMPKTLPPGYTVVGTSPRD
jgi:hypothetical protein